MRVTILLSNYSFENILSQCIDDNFPFLIDYIYSDVYLIWSVTLFFKDKEKKLNIFSYRVCYMIYFVVIKK